MSIDFADGRLSWTVGGQTITDPFTLMSELDAGVRESYSDVRELLLHFRVKSHTDDIEPALRETLSKFEHQSKLRAHLSLEGNG